ncbi:MAG: ABC-2 type transporter, partial [candidate division WS6 bacterium 34_10]
MKEFLSIFKKEIKELLTKEMIFSLVFMIMLFGLMGSFMNDAKEQTQEQLLETTSLAVLNLDNSTYSKEVLSKLEENRIKIVEIEKGSVEDAVKKTQQKGLMFLLVLPENFEESIKGMQGTEVEMYSMVKGIDVKQSTSSSHISVVVNLINQEISNIYIKNAFSGQDPENIINPIKTKEFVVVNDKVAPGNLETLKALSMANLIIIPILLMMSIMYAGTMIITSMGLEKENKTLETLLTLPVKRIS